jgi:hypothetical protein
MLNLKIWDHRELTTTENAGDAGKADKSLANALYLLGGFSKISRRSSDSTGPE